MSMALELDRATDADQAVNAHLWARETRSLVPALRGASALGAACLGLLVLAGCRRTAEEQPAPPQPPSVSEAPSADDPSLERAKRAAQAFSSQLRSALQGAMHSGGPEAAVEVCYAVAPAIAEEVMQTHGVRLGRVALPGKNRNPQQAAQGWQLAALTAMQAAVADGARPEEQVLVRRDGLPEGVALRMMRGIATEAVCVTCHGASIAAQVREAIARRYPGDSATGFAVGDLRGALWVEVPAR